VLDILGMPKLEGLDGTSFGALLRGGSDPKRDHVVTVFHETSARQRYEMRSLQDARYGYIYNPWSDGKRTFRNEPMNGRTFAAMKEAAPNAPAIAARVDFFLHRAPEEFYDLQADPDALRNRIAEPGLKSEVDRYRRRLLDWMRRTGDPLAGKLEKLL
jgi:N-sulfoglucosamine sulfohydrolase